MRNRLAIRSRIIGIWHRRGVVEGSVLTIDNRQNLMNQSANLDHGLAQRADERLAIPVIKEDRFMAISLAHQRIYGSGKLNSPGSWYNGELVPTAFQNRPSRQPLSIVGTPSLPHRIGKSAAFRRRLRPWTATFGTAPGLSASVMTRLARDWDRVVAPLQGWGGW